MSKKLETQLSMERRNWVLRLDVVDNEMRSLMTGSESFVRNELEIWASGYGDLKYTFRVYNLVKAQPRT